MWAADIWLIATLFLSQFSGIQTNQDCTRSEYQNTIGCFLFRPNCVSQISQGQSNVEDKETIRQFLLSFMVSLVNDLSFKWGRHRMVILTDIIPAVVLKAFSAKWFSTTVIGIKGHPNITQALQDPIFQMYSAPTFIVYCNDEDTAQVLQAAAASVNRGSLRDPNVWVIFSNNIGVFNNIRLPVNTNIALAIRKGQFGSHLTAVDLLEVRRYPGHTNLIQDKFGIWIPGKGVDMMRPFPNFQLMLDGREFTIATIDSPPYTILSNTNSIGNFPLKGIFGDIMKFLSSQLNFSVRVVTPEDNEYGQLKENNEWSGIVGMLAKNSADIGVADFSMTSSRLKVVDFSFSVTFGTYLVAFRRPEAVEVGYFVYLLPFDWWTWILILVALFALSLGLTITCQFHPLVRCSQRPSLADAHFTYWNSLYTILCAFIQKALGTAPDCLAGRIVLWTALIFSVFIFATYTSTFTSHLTISTTRLPFDSLKQLAYSDYDIGLQTGTSYEENMKSSKTEVMQMLWSKIAEDDANLVSSVPDGIAKAYTEKFAFISESLSTTFALSNNCSFSFYNIRNTPEGYYFIFKKDFLFTRNFKYYINLMLEAGLIQQIRKRYVADVCTAEENQSFTQLALKRVICPFLCLSAGLAVALISFLVESVIKKNKQFVKSTRYHIAVFMKTDRITAIT